MNTVIEDVIWVAEKLFDKGLVSGSTGNISFKNENIILISQSGSCFGKLTEKSFSKITEDNKVIHGNPSKEYPIHTGLYRASKSNKVVLHTHSFYTTLISCLKESNQLISELFNYTPYLKILTKGQIKVIDYADPGSSQLFSLFEEAISEDTTVYLMRNHGITIASSDVIKAFNILEEFEQTAKLIYHINCYQQDDFKKI